MKEKINEKKLLVIRISFSLIVSVIGCNENKLSRI